MYQRWPAISLHNFRKGTWFTPLLEKLRQPYFLYLLFIAGVGKLLLIRALLYFPTFSSQEIFLLLVGLILTTAFATTSIQVTEIAGITYHIGPAVAFAAVPVFGAEGAILLVAADQIGMQLLKRTDQVFWKKSLPQLFFNMGMMTISMYAGGKMFTRVASLDAAGSHVVIAFAWLLGAVVYAQVNAGLLLIILRLQHGAKFNPLSAWASNLWAMALDLVLMFVGGGALAYAMVTNGWVGVGIFFLPVLLSALAFRLYVAKMNEHMANLESIIAERTKELADLNAEKDAFLAVLAHDMKSPLAAIEMYTTLLIRKPEMAVKKPSITENIRRSQHSLHTMVNDILDLGQLQAGEKLAIQPESFDFVELLTYIAENHRGIAANKAIALSLQLPRSGEEEKDNPQPSPPVSIVADRLQLERVLNNLISNAIKYTPENGTICISLRVREDQAIVSVSDTGYGIPQSDLPHIFGRYRRVEKHKSRATGVGLGLAITKAIVDAHRGSIEVESVENQGSTFTIRLPLAGLFNESQFTR